MVGGLVDGWTGGRADGPRDRGVEGLIKGSRSAGMVEVWRVEAWRHRMEGSRGRGVEGSRGGGVEGWRGGGVEGWRDGWWVGGVEMQRCGGTDAWRGGGVEGSGGVEMW